LLLWLTLYASGLQPTLAGVAMGLLVPTSPVLSRDLVRSRTDDLLDVFTPEAARETTRIAKQAVSQLEWLEHQLHGWSSLVIVPVFALANAGVTFTSDMVRAAATSSITVGIVVALVVGKTLGILGGAWVGTRTGIATLPDETNWRQIAGVAVLGGIGFTVSLFIADLAFDSQALVDEAKIGIFVASVVAGAAGAVALRRTTRSIS
jgi:Na+/H+ antiporter NhaA